MPVPVVQRVHRVNENVVVDDEYIWGLQERHNIVNQYFAL